MAAGVVGWPKDSDRGDAPIMRGCLRRFLTFALLASGLVMLGGSFAPAGAAEKDQSNKGERLLRENCARCHAIGPEGDSPNLQAPPFRTLSSKYPVDSLAESLAEGIVSGHPDMPIFVFKAHDVEAIIAYLESIQTAPAEDETSPVEEQAPPAEQ